MQVLPRSHVLHKRLEDKKYDDSSQLLVPCSRDLHGSLKQEASLVFALGPRQSLRPARAVNIVVKRIQ